MDIGVMHIKLLIAVIFMAFLTSSMVLYAGATLNENGNLSISVKKLKAAHESGELILKSGQKFKVEGELISDKFPNDQEMLTSEKPSDQEHRFIKFKMVPKDVPSTETTYVYTVVYLMNLTLSPI